MTKKMQYLFVLVLIHFSSAAISQVPEGAMVWAKWGMSAQQKGNYSTATQFYDRAIKEYPAYAICYIYRGKCYSELAKYDLAIQDFSKSIELSLTPYYLYDYRGKAYTMIGKYELALADFNKSIEESKYNPDVYFNRAEMYRRLRQYDKALEDSKLGLHHSGFSTNGYYEQGSLYDRMRLYDLAIEAATNSIKISQTPNSLNDRAYYYGRKGVLDSAIMDFTKAITLNPDFQYAYSGRGRTYFQMGEYENAITDFKKATSLDRDYVNAHLNIIFPLARLNRFKEAANYYNRFLAIETGDSLSYPGWSYVRYFIKAACISVQQNKYEQALSEIKLAEQNCIQQEEEKNATEISYYSSIMALKGYVLDKLNRNAEASDAYKQALVINAQQPDLSKALKVLGKKQELIIQEDKESPAIEIINPQPSRSFEIESDNQATKIVGRAKDVSGIASIKINDRLVNKTEEDGLFITELPLKAGANVITITATDNKGNAATKSFTINSSIVEKNKTKGLDIPALAGTTSKYYAILIAEKDYTDANIRDLENPVRDAEELKKILLSKYTFDITDIDTLYNRTREEIMERITQRCNALTENDNLLIFYAGHGIAIKDLRGDVEGYWVPVSAKKNMISTYISASDIKTSLKRSLAKHILVVADACFGGALTRDIGSDADPSIQKLYKYNSRKVMASGSLEPVPDNSKFFYYLKKTLIENTEKYITGQDVFNNFFKAVARNTDTKPEYSAILNVGDEGGDFVFIKK